MFSFSGMKTRSVSGGIDEANLEIRKRGRKSHSAEKREFVLEADLPLGYNIGINGVLSAPDLLCHLSNPKTHQYHVTR